MTQRKKMPTQAQDIARIVSFVVPGAPSPKHRPRVTQSHTYTPDPTGFAGRVAGAAIQAGVKVYDGPVEVSFTIWRRMPQAWSKKKRRQMHGAVACVTPDVYNVLMAIGDALKGVAYPDDKYGSTGRCVRLWGEIDETEIVVMPLHFVEYQGKEQP